MTSSGAAWQQCEDQVSGYPYFWNTITNEVRWDCPPDSVLQWTRGAHVSLPPPGLVTNISLATPVTTPTENEPVIKKTTTSSYSVVTKQGIKSSLVSGYDSDDNEEEEENTNVEVDSIIAKSSDVEKRPGFIGPLIPKPDTPERVKSRSNSKETDDILSLIEAEKPPDYIDHVEDKPEDRAGVSTAKVTLPSAKPRSRESSQPKQTNSILQLASNYDDSDNDDDDTLHEIKPVQNKVTKIDSSGRLVFNSNDEDCDWQTDEQRAALEKYKIENIKTETLRQSQDKQQEVLRNRFDNSIPGSRKRRLDLPRGKFNKTDNSEPDPAPSEPSEPVGAGATREQMNFVPFVKSSDDLPGTIDQSKTTQDLSHDNTDLHENNHGNSNEETGDEAKENETESEKGEDDVSSFTAELVEKMEHFKVGQEKVSALKTVAIKLEALYSAWSAGALTLSYLKVFLQNARKKVEEAEKSLANFPWRAVWDRNSKVYKYLNEEDNSLSLIYPPQPKEPSSSPPPLPSDDLSNSSHPPPPPPPEDDEDERSLPTSHKVAQPPAPLNGADHQLQDMDIDEDPNLVDNEGENITDQLSQFYTEIGDVPEEDSVEADSVPDDVSSTSQCSAPNSPRPESPVNHLPKKRKKVKVSNNLSLKRKGVGDMLAKWQNIKN